MPIFFKSFLPLADADTDIVLKQHQIFPVQKL